MEKRTEQTLWWIIGILVVLAFGYALYHSYRLNSELGGQVQGSQVQTNAADEAAVKEAVTNFGMQIQKIPLSGAQSAIVDAINTNYAPYVDPSLLAAWVSNPESAPGRQVSSPWPDHIDVKNVLHNSDGSYTVSGEIIEMTSTGESGREPVALTVKNINGRWLITSYQQFSDKG